LPQFFFDTSSFVKRYHEELGADQVARVFETAGSVFQLSNLGILEAQSAFSMNVRTGEISLAQANSVNAGILRDVADNLVTVLTIEPRHFEAASVIISKYGFQRRMRTLDALQLAVALDLRSKNLLDVFVVADRLLAEIGALEGLSGLNPEDNPGSPSV
jgi:predicted nucleic acid-binding protein